MNMNKMAAGGEPFDHMVAICTRTNQMVVEQGEKWVEMRMDSLRAHVDLGLSQAKVALKVTDPHSLNEFVDSQLAVLSFVGHRMMEDSRALVEWGVDCVKQADRLIRRNALQLLFKD